MTEDEALELEDLKATTLDTLCVAMDQIKALRALCLRAADAMEDDVFSDVDADLIAELRKAAQ